VPGRRHIDPTAVRQKKRHDPPAVPLHRRNGNPPKRPDTLNFLIDSRQRDHRDRLAWREEGKPHCQPADLWLLQCEVPRRRKRLGLPDGENHVLVSIAIWPGEFPAMTFFLGLPAMCPEIVHGHALDPMGQRMGQQPLRFAGFQLIGGSEHRCRGSRVSDLLLQAGDHAVHGFLHFLGIQDRLDIHLVKHVTGLGRVEDIACLVDAELLKDDC